MIRPFHLALGATLLWAMVPASAATAMISGRGPGNASAYPETPFPATPALIWKSFQGSDFAGKTPSNLLIVDKSAIVALGDKLVAISTDTGEQLWKKDLPGVPVGDILWLDDQIVVTVPEAGVSAYSATDGAQIWTRSLFSTVVNGPTYDGGSLILSSKGNTLEVIARKTGKKIASVPVHDNIEAAPVILGKSVMMCFKNGNVVRMENGINRWSVALPKSTITLNPVSSGSTVLVTSADTVFALNPTAPNTPIRWSYPCADMTPDPPAFDATRVYLATKAGRLHALDASTGKDLWGDDGISLLAPAVAAPQTIGDNVLVRMKYGLLAAYTKDTGKLNWSYRLPADSATDLIVGAPATDGTDLYFATSNGNICHLAVPMTDVESPTFRKILPTMAGTELSNSQPLAYIGAIVEDEGTGVQPDSVTLKLDQTDLTAKLQYNQETGYYYVPLTPAQPVQPGLHTLVMTAKDNRGNLGTLTKEFYVGNSATIERIPISIDGEYVPKSLKVRPGTIIEWINRAGGPRSVVADNQVFNSDTQFATGIPYGENFVWVVPENARPGSKIFYHCRFNGEAGDGNTLGHGLAGSIEIVDLRRDVPGLPKYKASALPNFPVPDFAKK